MLNQLIILQNKIINNSQSFRTQTSLMIPTKIRHNSYQIQMNEGSPLLKNHPSIYQQVDKKYPDDNLVKKAPQQKLRMRQTFDVGTSNRIKEQLVKYDPQHDDRTQLTAKIFTTTESGSKKRRLNMPTYLNIKPQLNIQYDHRTRKSPISARKVELQNKFKSYLETVDKFQDQLEASSKMEEQLRKIKEDRVKRRQQKQRHKQKQIIQIQKKINEQSTGVKKLYDYLTPKEPKLNQQEYKKSRYNRTLDLGKYKCNILSPVKNSDPHSTKMDQSTRKQTLYSSHYSNQSQKHSNSSHFRIGQFLIGKKLGQGKFGTVYKAFHLPTNMIFAIKKVPKSMIRQNHMIDQFILELKLQSFVEHQNILEIYHFFEDSLNIYLVLQYMQGGTLFSQLKKNKKLTEPQVSAMIKQVSSAVHYLHERSIAHRDIKPENIVLTNGVCKLCDFGWATVCQDRRHTYCGTFDYAPPQILEGADYDFTVDLWCLGVLTYELLVGKAPFYHISRQQTKKKIINVQRTHIDFPDYLSRDTISFINSLLRKNPEQRLSSADLFQHPFLKNCPEDQ